MGEATSIHEVEDPLAEYLFAAKFKEVFQHLPTPSNLYKDLYTWDSFVYLPGEKSVVDRFISTKQWIQRIAEETGAESKTVWRLKNELGNLEKKKRKRKTPGTTLINGYLFCLVEEKKREVTSEVDAKVITLDSPR